MITGDNALTAAFIGQQLKYGNGPSLFVECLIGKEGQIAWQDVNDKRVTVTKSVSDLETLSKSALLIIQGNLLDDIFLW